MNLSSKGTFWDSKEVSKTFDPNHGGHITQPLAHGKRFRFDFCVNFASFRASTV
jgi:hypothetical protein